MYETVHETVFRLATDLPRDEHGHRLWPYSFGPNKTPYTYVPGSARPVRMMLWEHLHGAIEHPRSVFIGTTCDDEACVEPEHLVMVRRSERMLSTMAAVERKPYTKVFSAEDLEPILAARAAGQTWVQLAKRYNVTPAAVARFVQRSVGEYE